MKESKIEEKLKRTEARLNKAAEEKKALKAKMKQLEEQAENLEKEILERKQALAGAQKAFDDCVSEIRKLEGMISQADELLKEDEVEDPEGKTAERDELAQQKDEAGKRIINYSQAYRIAGSLCTKGSIAQVWLRGTLAVDHGALQPTRGQYIRRGKCACCR